MKTKRFSEKNTKELSALIASLLMFSLIPRLVLADGGVFIDYADLMVSLPSQKAAIAWDGKIETLILFTKIGVDNLTNMAWIVPLPSKAKPEISEGDIQIFYDLADLFSWKRTAPGFWTAFEAPEVIEFKKVDIYDITTLKATNATALVSWLNENGYVVPESTIPILQEYCDQQEFYFIANKINLANKYKNLTITDADEICAEIIKTRLNEPFWEEFEDIDAKIEYLWNEEEICAEANLETVKVLVELKRGIATPIKIQFQPPAPFYPLKISSINNGSTGIDVYFFSETPAKDNSEILSISHMTKSTPLLKEKHGFDQRYITYLVYSGDLKELSSDAWFEPTQYDSDLDPNHVSIFHLIFPIVLIGFIAVGIIAIGFLLIMKNRRQI